MQNVIDQIQKHWVAYLVGGVVTGLSLFAAMWPIFTKDTVPEVIGRFQLGDVLYRGIVVGGVWFLGVTLLLFVVAMMRFRPNKAAPVSLPSSETVDKFALELLSPVTALTVGQMTSQKIDAAADAFMDGKLTVSEVIDAVRLPVELKWGVARRFEATSKSPDMLATVKCELINALRWLPDPRRWSTSGETHPNGDFWRLTMNGKHNLHYDQPVSFGSLAMENNNRLFIEGFPLGSGRFGSCSITTAAKWRLDFRIEDASGRAVEQSLCFEWGGPGQEPRTIPACKNVEFEA